MMEAIFNYNEHYRNRFVEQMAKQIPAGSKVLDAGAGTCKYRHLFSHCDYQAQDFAKYSGEEHVYGELNFICDITEIPVDDGCFDVVLCTEVLEHVPHPDLAVAEFSRLLKPSGRLIITAPLGSAIHMPPYHFYGGFSPYWYEYFFAKNNLKLECCEANGGFFKLYGQESRRFSYMLRPKNAFLRLLLFPFEILWWLMFSFFIPLVCHYFDRFDVDKEHTAGYFVVACKQENQ